MVSFRPAVEEQTVAPAPEKVVVLLIEKGERGLVSGRPMRVQEKAC